MKDLFTHYLLARFPFPVYSSTFPLFVFDSLALLLLTSSELICELIV